MKFNDAVDIPFEVFLVWNMNVTKALHNAIQCALAGWPEGGWVDSYVLAATVCRHNPDADPHQQRDYIQHLLRECTHVCRYAHDHQYRVHEEDRCSDACVMHGFQPPAASVPVQRCPSCFLELPATGHCDLCA